MAYYTICHLLHTDVYGHVKGPLNIDAKQMNDEVWDYIFCRRELGDDVLQSGIPNASLSTMRRNFSYEYPLTLRSSGKDLINNHLTFFLNVHLAIWGDQPQFWPEGIRCNGHLMLNGDKMSKSTGNFMTLQDLVKKYGADATRIGLANAGGM
jgi:leucyl-tRNA synthetase